MARFTRTVEVEVNLADFPIETIIEHLRDLGHEVDPMDRNDLHRCSDQQLLQEVAVRELDSLDQVFGEQIEAIHQALRLNQDAKALALTRAMIKAHTGCAVI